MVAPALFLVVAIVSAEPTGAPDYLPRVGDKVVLRSVDAKTGAVAKKVPVAVGESALGTLTAFNKAKRLGDTVGIEELEKEGRLIFVADLTPALVLDLTLSDAFQEAVVRITEGPHAKEMGLVMETTAFYPAGSVPPYQPKRGDRTVLLKREGKPVELKQVLVERGGTVFLNDYRKMLERNNTDTAEKLIAYGTLVYVDSMTPVVVSSYDRSAEVVLVKVLDGPLKGTTVGAFNDTVCDPKAVPEIKKPIPEEKAQPPAPAKKKRKKR